MTAAAPENKKSRPRRWRRRIIWLLVVIVVLALALRISVSIILPTVLNKVAKTYNLACQYDRLDLNLLDGSTAIWNLRLTPRQGGEPICRADYCQGDISIAKLFRGRLVVYRVAADGVDLTIERTAAGQMPLLDRFTSRSGAAAVTAAGSPSKPITLEPPLRVDALRLEHVRARFLDEFVKPRVDTRIALDLRVTDLRRIGEPTRFELDFSSDPLLDSLEIHGQGKGDGKSLTADLHVLLRGLHPKPAAGYLALVGLRPTADSISASVDGALLAQVAPNSADGIQGDLTFTNARVTCDGQTAAAMDHLSLDAQALAPGLAKLGKISVSGVRISASRNQHGNIAALGIEISPSTQPTTTATAQAPAISTPPAVTSAFRWSLGQFTMQDVHVGFDDTSVSPAVSTGVDLKQLDLKNLSSEADHPDEAVDFSAELSAPGMVRSIVVQGHAQPFAQKKPFALRVGAVGILPAAIEPYLHAAGVESQWKDGTFQLAADGSVETVAGGRLAASARLTKFTLSDGDTLLDIGPTEIADASVDPSSDTIHVGAIRVSGPTFGIMRDSHGDFHLLGFKTATPCAPPTAGASTAAENSSTTAATPMVLPNIEVDQFSWKDIRLSLIDQAVRPAAVINISDAGVSAQNIGLYLSGKPHAPRQGTIEGHLSVPGVVSSAALSGTVASDGTRTGATFDVRIAGIQGKQLATYLKTIGAEPTWRNGSARSWRTVGRAEYRSWAANIP